MKTRVEGTSTSRKPGRPSITLGLTVASLTFGMCWAAFDTNLDAITHLAEGVRNHPIDYLPQGLVDRSAVCNGMHLC
ncbi:hypothetical protein UAJ10_28230 [Nitrospirillum sp. BR 11164]|uniref:hypothetical protein n=1 Tax=Nitrospirillum sp. BR 11164 TaxID=3104324 RepID=UPI002AFEAA04|nr:hypothetical protein [Nitrospirillum sp. BR 11164]MEA1652892.1 hypothetical protein [Nitrospirillum sp. BR 11164]